MNIPSNATLEEAIKYFLPRDISEIVENILSPFLDKIEEVEEELQAAYKKQELLEDSDGFKTDLLEEIQSLCKETGSKRDLVKAINIAFETSYVEL